MKKGLLLLMAGFMAFGVAVQSLASARIDSMATDPRFIEDYDLIWLYPNKVLEYKNTADFRLNAGPWSGTYPQNGGFGGGTNEWGGFLIEEETFGGVLGIYVNRPNRLYTSAHSLAGSGWIDQYRYYWDSVGGSWINNGRSPWNIIDVFYGTGLDGADLGIHLNYGDNGINTNGTETSVIGVGLGLGFKDMGPFNEGNIHADFRMFDYFYNNSAAPNADNGIFDIKVGGLFSADAGNDTSIRLSGDVLLLNSNETDTDGTTFNHLDVLLGLACNHKVNGGKGLVSTGLLIDWTSWTWDDGTEQNGNNWTIIWNGSVEAAVTNWLTLRAGIQKALLSRSYYRNVGGPGNYSDLIDNDVSFTTGIGVTWQNFTIDGVIDVSTLESWLSGPNAGAGIFYPGVNGGDGQGIVALTEIDVKYKF